MPSMPDRSMFSPPKMTATVPLYEYLLCVASEFADGDAVLILQDPGNEVDTLQSNTITWRQLFADAHLRAKDFVQATGLSARGIGATPVVVGLLARNGYQYLVSIIALITLRWTTLLISPQNSSDAVRHLLKSTGSRCLLLEEALASRYRDLFDETLPIALVPLASQLCSPHANTGEVDLRRTSVFSEDELLKECRTMCFFMHTSGSTGHPKPIPWTHEYVVSMIIATGRDRIGREDALFYTPLPLCHGGGFSTCLPIIAGRGGISVFVEPHGPVSSGSVMRHIRLLRGRDLDILLIPSILEDMADGAGLSSTLDCLVNLNTVLQGGAPLRTDVGDQLANGGVKLVTWGGITEAGVFASSRLDPCKDPSDWSYITLVKDYEFNFIPFDKEHAAQGYQLVMSPGFITPPILNNENPVGFLTPDLWTRHPDPAKAHLWKIAGRLDDVMALSNGEKVNGKQLETLLCSSPLISHAVIFGAGRFLCGALLRPSPQLQPYDSQAVASYLDRIWPYITTSVNEVVPRHSRLLRPLILVENPDKPFLLSDKGTIKKQATLALYDVDIEEAYRKVELGNTDETREPASSASTLDPSDEAALLALVESHVAATLGKAVGRDEDFFDAGLDSLLAVKLRYSIISAFRDSGTFLALSKNVIYAYPTATSLAKHLGSVYAQNTASTAVGIPDEMYTNQMVEDAIASFTTNFGFRRPERGFASPSFAGNVYAVTGTTGSLGSTLLSVLLERPEVSKIYCFNRRSKATTGLSMAERHQSAFCQKGLDYSQLEGAVRDGRVVYLETTLNQPALGLDGDVYTQLTEELTHIVHIAWPISFALSFPSFVPQLSAVRHLIDLSLSSRLEKPPHMIFTSSIAVAGRVNCSPICDCSPASNSEASQDMIPEASLPSLSHALPHGYAAAKFAAEKIIEAATAHCNGFTAKVVRCGQIAGATTTGAWPRKEFVPAILRASVLMRAIPNDLPDVNWLPVDCAAKVLFHLTQTQPSPHTLPVYYGLENPLALSWSKVLSSVAAVFPTMTLRSVSRDEWLQLARKSINGESPHNQGQRETRHQHLHIDDLIDPSLLDYIEGYVFKESLAKLQTSNAEQIVGRKLLAYVFESSSDEQSSRLEAIERYVKFATCLDGA